MTALACALSAQAVSPLVFVCRLLQLRRLPCHVFRRRSCGRTRSWRHLQKMVVFPYEELKELLGLAFDHCEIVANALSVPVSWVLMAEISTAAFLAPTSWKTGSEATGNSGPPRRAPARAKVCARSAGPRYGWPANHEGAAPGCANRPHATPRTARSGDVLQWP